MQIPVLLAMALLVLQGIDVTSAQDPTVDPIIAVPPAVCLPIIRCGVNEIFSCCGPCAQANCFYDHTPLILCKKCNLGCFCRPGYIRKYPGGPCVRKITCNLVFDSLFSV